ncbi:MAG: hypothetical protein U1C51_06845 [Candidatus Izemoplasmatales bacterium]|nr:hypothetical protein [bacterium]MDZ4196939.1 hypothetical protein [Candidatus Izemoplasmatales bacterium]
MFSRNEVKTDLFQLLSSNKSILAVWEGGSAATNYLDDVSDMDISIVCQDDAVEMVFSLLDQHLQSKYSIIRKLRMPEPSWHGFSQCFYLLDQVPPLFYLDIAIIKESIQDKFTQSDRHGHAVIWFDPQGLHDPTPSTLESQEKKAKQLYKNATSTDFLMELECKKAIARQNFMEAFPAMYNYLARNLVPLLNILHRLPKADFGLRYIYRDYPESDHLLVQEALQVSSMDALQKVFYRLLDRFQELQLQLHHLYSNKETIHG